MRYINNKLIRLGIKFFYSFLQKKGIIKIHIYSKIVENKQREIQLNVYENAVESIDSTYDFGDTPNDPNFRNFHNEVPQLLKQNTTYYAL